LNHLYFIIVIYLWFSILMVIFTWQISYFQVNINIYGKLYIVKREIEEGTWSEIQTLRFEYKTCFQIVQNKPYIISIRNWLCIKI